MLLTLLFAAMVPQDLPVKVAPLDDRRFELTLNTAGNQVADAVKKMNAAMETACEGAGVAQKMAPLILNTADKPPRFIIMQTIVCKPKAAPPAPATPDTP